MWFSAMVASLSAVKAVALADGLFHPESAFLTPVVLAPVAEKVFISSLTGSDAIDV